MAFDENGNMNIELLDYNNRTDTRKRYAKHLIRNGKGIQAAEINEIQDTAHLRTKSIGDAIWKDGEVIAGLDLGIDTDNDTANCGDGTIYINGEVHAIAAKEIRVTSDDQIVIGIWYRERIITELQDGTLRDPAQGTPNYQQPGAGRLKVTTEWGVGTEEKSVRDDFYPLYTVSNKEIIEQPKSKTESDLYISKAYELVRKYDRDSNGSYVVSGLEVSAVDVTKGSESTTSDSGEDGATVDDSEKGKSVYIISAGKAHVNGYEVEQPFMLRLVVDEQPTVLEVEAEQHEFTEETGGAQKIDFYYHPVEEIKEVTIRREVTKQITRGSFSGNAMDDLEAENGSVYSIVEATQKAKNITFQQGTDYKLSNGAIMWISGGKQPNPGETYEVKYQYNDTIAPEDYKSTSEQITITGAVKNSPILLKYDYRLPRVDLICVNSDGAFTVIYGVSHRYAPTAPAVPSGWFKLAEVKHDWVAPPQVTNNAIRVTTMQEQNSMYKYIMDLYDLVSQERLKTDAIASAPTTSRGVFVDPFIDDDMRNGGVEQTCAIVDGTLMLPISVNVQDENDINNTSDIVLEYEDEIVLSQTMRTKSMQINPYQNTSAPPANVTVTPNVDRWEEVQTQWTSATTRTIVTRISNAEASAKGYANVSRVNAFVTTGSTSSVEVAGRSSTAARTMRARTLSVYGTGFNGGERVEVRFNGKPIHVHNANSNGIVSGCSFTVPTNTPCGTVQIEMIGDRGVRGSCTYTATGTITTETRRYVTVFTQDYYDPLAETFVLPESRYITGVDLFFVKRGATDVRVQIRDTATGIPNRTVFAEGKIERSAIKTGQSNRIKFNRPVLLDANVEYALVVLTDDPGHEIAIAEMGKRDIGSNQWITSQPYETGVLLSSSNASTWTPHQTEDMWFRLLGAKFVKTKRTVKLGDIQMQKVSDLLPLAEVDYPDTGAEATFVVKEKDSGKEMIRIQAGQAIGLEKELTGLYEVELELTGKPTLSPVFYSGAQFIQGSQSTEGDYVSRMFACGAGKKIRLTINECLPNGSAMNVKILTSGTDPKASSAYTKMNEIQSERKELGEGWIQRTYESACGIAQTCIRIEMSGTPKARPYCASLRAVVLDA